MMPRSSLFIAPSSLALLEPLASPSPEIAYQGHGLTVRKGEVFGIAGLAGAGQRELVLKILGKPATAREYVRALRSRD